MNFKVILWQCFKLQICFVRGGLWINKVFSYKDIKLCCMYDNSMAPFFSFCMSAGVTVNSVHPGLVHSRTWQYLPGPLQPIFKFMLKVFFKVCNTMYYNCEHKYFLNVLSTSLHVLFILSFICSTYKYNLLKPVKSTNITL